MKIVKFCVFRSSASQGYNCVKIARIRSYSGPHFSAFRLNTERYENSVRMRENAGKMRTRITPNTDSFNALYVSYFGFGKSRNWAPFSKQQKQTNKEQKTKLSKTKLYLMVICKYFYVTYYCVHHVKPE